MSTTNLDLRVLDPHTDISLFEESYNWRPTPKRHVGTNRASFETYIADDPRQIVIGVFNGQFIAAFLFYEFEPQKYDAHFTSRKGMARGTLLKGAQEVIDALFTNGAKEITAWIVSRNTPLRRFVEDLKFVAVESKRFACQNDTGSDTLSGESEPPTRSYVKYVLQG